MIDLASINKYTIARPAEPSFFGTADEFDALPETHKDQILFLDKAASTYIHQFAVHAHLVTGGIWDPFEKGNFKHVESFDTFWRNEEGKQLLKKWLFNRGISFRTWVFVLINGNDDPMLMTWKMVIKYSDDLFRMDDKMFFDQTLNWCMFYFHEGEIFFGKDNIYDVSEDYKKMELLNERKRKFPLFKHPYL